MERAYIKVTDPWPVTVMEILIWDSIRDITGVEIDAQIVQLVCVGIYNV